MKDDILKRLLGDADERDPGCEACFPLLDRWADAALAGEAAAERFPELLAHLANCAACREDAEGLLAALRRDANSTEET